MNAVHILLLICPISLAVLRAPDVRCWAEFSSADAGFRHRALGRTAGGQQTHRSRSPKTNQAGTRHAFPHCRADVRSTPGAGTSCAEERHHEILACVVLAGAPAECGHL